jgi:signal transduction histidine kinase
MVTDRDMVGRILTNLLDNALKYSPEDAPCGVAAGFDDGRIVFRVRDQGIGIDPRDLPRIFESFYQADSSTVRRFGGAGLGLYVTKRLVEHLGGDIAVASTPGEGSVFTVTLPVSPPAVAAAQPLS